jgi:hypothetical protein
VSGALAGWLLGLVLGATPTPAVPVAAAPVTVRWTARQEQQTYGYLVYRAADRSGPFLRISREIVRVPAGASSGETGPRAYRFVDAEVEAGGTYFYYIDSVQLDGRKRRLTGVLSRQVGSP